MPEDRVSGMQGDENEKIVEKDRGLSAGSCIAGILYDIYSGRGKNR